MRMLMLIICIFSVLASMVMACTGITVKTVDGDIIQARTVEYGQKDLESQLIITPRGKEIQSLTTEGKMNGLKWITKYGYVGISMINEMFIGEGMNEAGLSAGIFNFPHYGSLKKYNPENASKTLVDMEFVKWILGNFGTVDELKSQLNKIDLVTVMELDKGDLPTGHWRVADSKGNNIVIEIVDKGKINIFDNKVGILTNSPDYEWQVKNLNNYVNLYSGNATGYSVNGEDIFSFGAGTGMLGLPGDITPPSRFVRAFFFLRNLKTSNNTAEGIANAFHILNNFDIPIGLEYGVQNRQHMPNDLLTATQWTTASDLKNKEFYYKSMTNSQIRKIDLKNINFSEVKYQILPLDENDGIKEITIS